MKDGLRRDEENLGQESPWREKYWSEISIEEKIERIRGQVKDLLLMISHWRKAINSFQNHVHVEGQIYSPLHLQNLNDPLDFCRTGKGDDVFF